MDKLLLTLLFSLTIFIGHGQTKYVKYDGTGDGSSWANASGDLKGILDAATSGTEVWVAQGTYSPTLCHVCTTDDRDIYFEVKDGVKLYGGFVGTETSLDQRDWEAHPTILNGDINQDGDDTNNSYTIVYFQWVSSNTVLDGFIIEKGYAKNSDAGFSDRSNAGGGIYNYGSGNGYESSPTIKNCIIRDNYVAGFGGGLFSRGSYYGKANPYIENCIISGNTTGGSGGGMMNDGSSKGQANTKYYKCTFDDNMSEGSGAGLMNYAIDGTCSPEFTNCRISNNDAAKYGGAMYNHGKNGNASPTLINCLIERNTADSGSGIYNLGSEDGNSSPDVVNCVFYKNAAAQQCGAFYCNAGDETGTSNAILTNCVFFENTAPNFKIFKIVYGHPSISYSSVDVANATALNDDVHDGELTIGNGMSYNVDPLFIDADSGNFHLADNSSLIDAGDDAVIDTFDVSEDYENANRIQGEHVDINIYERAMALPVEWVSFDANKLKNTVELQWTVASQYDNEVFLVERSIDDAKHFAEIGFVAGDGTLPEKKSFYFQDENPAAEGLVYYRIRQIDYDGSFSLTNIRVVKFDSEQFDISVYPNPVINLLTITHKAGVNTTFILFDAAGRKTMAKNTNPNNDRLVFDCSDLQEGMYFLMDSSGKTSTKIMVH